MTAIQPNLNEDPNAPTALLEAPVLEVSGLSIEFRSESGWLRVVDDLKLSIGRGETLGLVGESGCGKTVTSLAIMGLLDRSLSRMPSGSIRLEGRELFGSTERVLADVRGADMGMVFQEPRRSLNPSLTIGQQIAEVVVRHEGVSRKDARSRALAMLDVVGIDNAARRINDYPHQFSGGMCQRVMLAMALVCKPKLLIADEATTALDVTVQAKILMLMKDLQSEFGVSILFITHDMSVVDEMCDRVAVMYSGQVVEYGPRDSIFDWPQHPYTAGLLASIPSRVPKGERLVSIPGSVPRPWDKPSGCRFHPRCEFAVAGRCDVSAIPIVDAGMAQVIRCVRVSELPFQKDAS